MQFKIIKWIGIVEIIIIFITISILYYLSIPLHLKRNIIIKSSNANEVINHLKKTGYDVGIIDEIFLSNLGEIKKGRVYLGKNNNNRLDILKIIASSQGRYKRITLIPGETTIIFLEQLSKKMNFNINKLQKSFDSLCRYKEASILANSYNIPINYSEKNSIKLLCHTTEKIYKKLSYYYYNRYNPNEWKHILIIASIIQKEAANIKEMPKISSVIRNRLKKKMRLQMDGALNYGKYSHIKVTPQRIKSDNTTYNTYKHRGLPKEPVCNVSIQAIKSAINPLKTNYLYFIKKDSFGHIFTSNYKEHLKNIRKKRKNINFK